MTDERASLSEARPRWVDIHLLEDLERLAKLVHEAIVSVHRINAINTAGDVIRPWTEEQFDFVERERLVAIAKVARCVSPRVEE